MKGKTITLKKGTRLKHERVGNFGPDYLILGNTAIDFDNMPDSYLSPPE